VGFGVLLRLGASPRSSAGASKIKRATTQKRERKQRKKTKRRKKETSDGFLFVTFF
jgi:hypothetical protein